MTFDFSSVNFNVYEKQVIEKLRGLSIHTNGTVLFSEEAYVSAFKKATHCLVFFEPKLALVGLQPINEDHPDVENAYKVMITSSDNVKDKRPSVSLKSLFKDLGWNDRLEEAVRVDEPQTIKWQEREMIVVDLSKHLTAKQSETQAS